MTDPPLLAPEVQELLAWDRQLGARLGGMSISEQRQVIRAELDELVERIGMTAPDLAAIRDYDIPADGGTIRLRTYTPTIEASLGLFFHIHGGGFTLGGIDWAINHLKCAHIAATAGCVVTTVDYRLAPEHPYPTAPQDCYAALVWVVEHASTLGVDPARLVVGGESAGGNLAAVMALMSRDLDGPPITLQLLEVPVADMSRTSGSRPSMRLFASGYGLDTTAIEAFTESYIPVVEDREEPYASPLFTSDLKAVAPAHILTAEFDPLRDGGEAYAVRLQQAGVRTTLHRCLGHTHGSSCLWSAWAPACAWMDEVTSAVRNSAGPVIPLA